MSHIKVNRWTVWGWAALAALGSLLEWYGLHDSDDGNLTLTETFVHYIPASFTLALLFWLVVHALQSYRGKW